MKKRILILGLSILFFIPLIISLDVGIGDDEIGIDLIPIVLPPNQTTLYVNSTEWWITAQGNMNNVPDLYPTLDLRYLEGVYNNINLNLTIAKTYTNTNINANVTYLNSTPTIQSLINGTTIWLKGLNVTTATIQKGLIVNADTLAQVPLIVKGSPAAAPKPGCICLYKSATTVAGYVCGETDGISISSALPDASDDKPIELHIDGGAIFNELGTSTGDHRIESDTSENMFFLDASANRIGIGLGSPLTDFHVAGVFRSNERVNVFPLHTKLSGQDKALFSISTIQPTSDSSAEFIGMIGQSIIGGVGDVNLTGSVKGAQYKIDMTLAYSSFNTVAETTALDSFYVGDSDFQGTVNDSYGIRVRGMDMGTTLPSGTVINATGIEIGEVSGATNNIAFKTNLGEVRLGDDVYIYNDNDKLYFGASDDVSQTFNASDWIFEAEVGTPNIYFKGFGKVNIDENLNVEGNITNGACGPNGIFWGEENAGLDTGYEWSHGNGATYDDNGIAMACAGVLTAMSVQCDACTGTTSTVEIRINNVGTDCETDIDTAGGGGGTYGIDNACSDVFAVGDNVNIFTIDDDGVCQYCTATFWIKYTY